MFSVFYSCGMIFEIFIPAFSGSEITWCSERLPYEIFKSNWTGQTKEFRKSLMILIERTLRAHSINAAGIFTLNLTTMLNVSDLYFIDESL